MSETTAGLALPYIMAAQAQKHVTHNEALQMLDALVQPVVQDMPLTDPPTEPSPGECFLVAANATGAWAGQDGAIAHWPENSWHFMAPAPGWAVHLAATGATLVWDGSDWVPPTAAMLGINATADETNRLTVASDASLFTHAGGGHQIKLNKAGAGDTASLLYQTGWGGRAEIGTAGEDALSIKVSPDGAGWTTALSFDPATGLASGAAVQTDAQDATPGRLMRADFGYGPATAVGPVTMDQGAQGPAPGGALIERGTGSAGQYLRFADGTQICWQEVTFTDLPPDDTQTQTWVFPATFADTPVVQSTVQTGSVHLYWAGCLVTNGVSAAIYARQNTSSDRSPRITTLAIGRWA